MGLDLEDGSKPECSRIVGGSHAKSLSKDPAKRFPTCEDFDHALAKCVNTDATVPNGEPWPFEVSRTLAHLRGTNTSQWGKAVRTTAIAASRKWLVALGITVTVSLIIVSVWVGSRRQVLTEAAAGTTSPSGTTVPAVGWERLFWRWLQRPVVP